MFIKNLRTLQQYNAHVTVHDPWANPEVARREYGMEVVNELPHDTLDAIILAVAQDKFTEINIHVTKNSNTMMSKVRGILQGNVSGKLKNCLFYLYD